MKTKLYFYHIQWPFSSESRIEISSEEYENAEYRTFICSHEVDLPEVAALTENEKAAALIKVFQDEKKDLQAKTHIKLTELDDKINQLLCLENKEQAVDPLEWSRAAGVEEA